MGKTNDVDAKKISQEVEEVKEIMQENLDLLLQRGKKLEEIDDKAIEMWHDSAKLKKNSQAYAAESRWKNYSYYFLAAGALAGTGIGVLAGFSSVVTVLFATAGAGVSYTCGELLNQFANYWNKPKDSVLPTKKVEPSDSSTLGASLGFTPRFANHSQEEKHSPEKKPQKENTTTPTRVGVGV